MSVQRFSHRDARAIIIQAFQQSFGREPTRPEAQCVQAVAWLETQYGAGWIEAGAGSNNWGAITAPASWRGQTFAHRDSRPRADGTSEWYVTRFKSYPSAVAGAEDLVRTVYLAVIGRLDRSKLVLPAATAGDTLAFSSALYDTGYYAGFGPTRDDRIHGHHLKVIDACTHMARELGEPMPDGSLPPDPPPRALRLTTPPMIGPDVRDVQIVVGAKADGVYGQATERAVKTWQNEHQLKPDGTWGAVCRDAVSRSRDRDTVPEIPRV